MDAKGKITEIPKVSSLNQAFNTSMFGAVTPKMSPEQNKVYNALAGLDLNL